MIKSMTGYGRGEFINQDYRVVVELKTVNHKYSDFAFRMSKSLGFAEDKIKGEIRKTVHRGKVEVLLSYEYLGEKQVNVQVNTALAAEYMAKLMELSKACGMDQIPGIDLIAKQPDVIVVIPMEENRNSLIEAILASTSEATTHLDEMRVVEGRALASDILGHLGSLKSIVYNMKPLADEVPRMYKNKLEERIAYLIDSDTIGFKDRIAGEVAIFADKANVDEEITRLNSHINQVERIISSNDESVGKRLDFLAQEMNREANTIGSKASDLSITNLVLEAKSEIEKIREQVQNIE